MKKNAIISLIALVLCLCIVVILLMVGGGRENGPTTPADSTTNATEPSASIPSTEDTVPPTTEPIVIPDNVHGTPGYMFESTLGREFDFSLKNLTSGTTWSLDNMSSYNCMADSFVNPYANGGPGEQLQMPAIEPYKTGLEVRFADGTNGIFVFGVVNESNQEADFEDCRLVYVSFAGESKWELCGLITGMTRVDAIQKIGNPTQEMNTLDGYSMEWYVYRDGHAYWINALLDSENGVVEKIVLNIDNHPVYANQ